MTTEIIDCGGKYEVHPSQHGGHWCVVNGESGQVYGEYATQQEAVRIATQLNAAL